MIRFIPRFRRIRTRLVVIYFFLAMAIIGPIGASFYYIARDALDKEMGRRLVLVAQIVASRLDAEELTELLAGDEDSFTYQTLVESINSLLDVGAASRIFVFDKQNLSLADTESVGIGTEYFRLAPHRMEIQRAFSGEAVDSAIFRGLDGHWYKSAFAPVHLGEEVVAAVGVEAGVTFFDTLRAIQTNLLLFGFFSAALIIGVSIVLALGFERPIARLVQSAQRLAEGDLLTKIEPTSRDEIGFLAGALDTARQRIVERDRNLKMLQRGIAHEVRNPLGGMRLFCDILSDELAGEADKAAYVDKIRREVLALEDVVSEFLDFTRELPLDLEKVKVKDFLEDFLAGYADLPLKNIALKLEVTPETQTASLDPGLIRRALFNLVNNAVQAMPEGGKLGMEVFKEDNRLEIVISDTGVGIKPEAIQHMFTPFYTTKDKGTGLGMPFAKKIFERHGGTIRLESEPGSGTRITIRLPVDKEGSN